MGSVDICTCICVQVYVLRGREGQEEGRERERELYFILCVFTIFLVGNETHFFLR